MAIISIINQKGGCGKTTSAVNLSTGLAKKGYRILLIDMDPQAHATIGLGFNADGLKKTIYDVIDEREVKTPFADITLEVTKRLFLAPANVYLSAFEQSMSGKAWRESRLAKSLAKVKNQYDHIVIDCPPSLSLLTINSLLASTHAIAPIDSGFFAIEGVKKLNDTLDMLSNRVHHDLDVKFLVTFYDTRSSFNEDFLSDLEKAVGKENVFKSKIRRSVKFNISQRLGKSVMEMGSKACGIAFRDYLNLMQEVVGWTKDTQNYRITMLDFAASKTSVRKNKLRTLSLKYQGKAGEVLVAGDFSDWKQIPMRCVNNEWQYSIKLNPGEYRYKFVVDGEWIIDPHNKELCYEKEGIANSLAKIKGK